MPIDAWLSGGQNASGHLLQASWSLSFGICKMGPVDILTLQQGGLPWARLTFVARGVLCGSVPGLCPWDSNSTNLPETTQVRQPNQNVSGHCRVCLGAEPPSYGVAVRIKWDCVWPSARHVPRASSLASPLFRPQASGGRGHSVVTTTHGLISSLLLPDGF